MSRWFEGAAALATLLLVACSADQLFGPGVFLTAADAKGSVHEPRPLTNWKTINVEYYIVSAAQLPRVRRHQSLTYEGTADGYHFIRAWNKMLREGEIDHLAVLVSECQVTNPRPIAEEAKIQSDQHRRVLLSDGCAVP